MIWKKFSIELYNSTIYVCLEPDGEKVLQRIKRAGFSISEGNKKTYSIKTSPALHVTYTAKREQTFSSWFAVQNKAQPSTWLS